MKKKILFVTNHLGFGGVDRAIVDIVNNMDPEKFDITLMALFKIDESLNKLNENINKKFIFKTYFKGFTKLLSMIPQKLLYKILIKENYDYEVAFQAGLPTLLLSNSTNKKAIKYAWIHGFDGDHIEQHKKFNKIIFVSEEVKDKFSKLFDRKEDLMTRYNPINEVKINEMSKEDLNFEKSDAPIICTIGRLSPEKGFKRLLEVHNRLIKEGIKHKLWIVGGGDEIEEHRNYLKNNGLLDTVTLWDYQSNPYKFIKNCDFYVCSSFHEGFSVAATEAIVLGKTVVTTDCCGMKELLGNNEYGIITENSTEGLYEGIKKMLTNKHLLNEYTNSAIIRSKDFGLRKTIKQIENLFR